MSVFKHLIAESHRRALWQVLGIYGLGAWVGYQVILGLVDGVGLPGWVPAFAIVLFIIGLPVVLTTAYIHGLPGRSSTVEPPVVDLTLFPDSQITTPYVTPSKPARPLHKLTWNRAILAGVLAFAVLGLAATGFIGMRAMGIGPAGSLKGKGLIEDQDAILIADFTTRGADTTMADVVEEALRIDLTQSRLIAVVTPEAIRDGLARMRRVGAKLDEATARELARREGIKAIVLGDIGAVGSGYVLSLSLIAAENGQSLVAERATAKNADDVIRAIDDLSKKLRERLGESLKAVNRAPALENATTESLEALFSFTRGRQASNLSDFDRAIPLFEDAVLKDSTFAMAWAVLGNAFMNRGGARPRAVKAFEAAYRHRERLPEYERLYVEGHYADYVEGNLEKSMAVWRSAAERFPHNRTPLHNWGNGLRLLGRYVEAESVFIRTLAVDSGFFNVWVNLAAVQFNLGKERDAWETIERMSRALPGTPRVRGSQMLFAAQTLDFAKSDSIVQAQLQEFGTSRIWEWRARNQLANNAFIRGQLRAGERELSRAYEIDAEISGPAQLLNIELFRANLDALYRNDSAAAQARAAAALRRFSLDSLDAPDRPLAALAMLFARTGDVKKAREFADRVSSEQPSTEPPARRGVEAVIALAEKRYADAANLARQGSSPPCRSCGQLELARAFEGMAQTDSAIATYERYLTIRTTTIDWIELPFIYERLGALHEQKGNNEKAKLNYARFTELWRNADPELQLRVRAATARLQALGPRG